MVLPWHVRPPGLAASSNVIVPESIATLSPFGPIEGHKWFFSDFQPMRVSEEPVVEFLNNQWARNRVGIWLSYRPAAMLHRAGIFKEAMGARNRGGRGLSYRPARLHRLAEFIPWNRFRGPIHI